MNRRNQRGFASLPMMTGVGILMTLSMTMVFRFTVMNKDQAAQVQLRVDYSQREEALMRAVVNVFPKKAIASLESNFAAEGAHSWDAIFAEAIDLSSVSTALSQDTVTALGLTRKRNGDVADQSAATIQSWITSLTGEPGKVTPGTTAYASVFSQAAFAGKTPPLLHSTDLLQTADALRPVVGPQKRYNAQAASLLADVTKYPVYNLIPYPNIRFGYAAPGEPFVAKRNWWAFTVNYGERNASVAKHYILSLYEVPSQMPIEAATFAAIGRHQDGTAWNGTAITISGSIYGDHLTVDGAYGADRINGRRSINIEGTVELGGVSLGNDFDALGVREYLQAQQRTDALPLALSANSGRLAFVPLQTGLEFLNRVENPNPWQAYAGGAQKCAMTVEAISMVSLEDQTPVKIRVRFLTSGGSTSEVMLERGVNWPTAVEAGGGEIPFQTELTNNSRSCLTLHPSLLDAWVQANGGAPATVNNSLYMTVNPSVDPLTVKAQSYPPAEDDMCVIVRKGRDLTNFSAGLSVVAPVRVYVGDDLNNVPFATVPAGSGLPADAEVYPSVSIFGAELRVGTTAFNRPIEHHGQLSTIATGTGLSWKPLDMKSGTDDTVHTDEITAQLEPLRSPAELPPVHQMNWLVVIEEIPQD